jgi:glycosyltransferase involved in cell wall biosynthesis
LLGILYISYDGILEPLGQSQVLSYLEKLSIENRIYLISFEKRSDKGNAILYNQVRKRISKTNIQWYPLIYHKNPKVFATLWDVFCAIVLSFWLILRFRLTVLHARSYIASLAAIAIKKNTNVKYIFDMRGFWADERVEGGLWPRDGYLFHVFKRLERAYLLNADVVVSLTNKAVQEMKGFPYLQERMPVFRVIPTCTDLEVFKLADRRSDNTFILGYVGSVGVWYLFEESLKFFKIIKEFIPDAKLHIINKGGHDYIYSYLNKIGIQNHDVIIEDTDHNGVAYSMQTMNAGIFIIKPVYSKIASMPTKLGEFLGCGVPCICNTGVGDMAEIIHNTRTGVVLDDFMKSTMKKGVIDLLKLLKDPDIKDRCRRASVQNFSLEKGVRSYSDIYKSII